MKNNKFQLRRTLSLVIGHFQPVRWAGQEIIRIDAGDYKSMDVLHSRPGRHRVSLSLLMGEKDFDRFCKAIVDEEVIFVSGAPCILLSVMRTITGADITLVDATGWRMHSHE